jgi:hypothetical protein
MRNALKNTAISAILATVVVGCGAAQLDPEHIASHIQLRPVSLGLQAGLDLANVGMIAGVEACNRNDVDVDLKRADWQALLDGIAVGAGQLDGPATLVAQKCSELKVHGHVDLTRAGAAAVSALLLGQPLAPVVVVDLTAAVWGVQVQRTVRLQGFAVLAPAAHDAGP